MIGNDIIDLDLAGKESNWQRKGFVDKIFTDREQELIFSHDVPEIMVWMLWSMKESAYKVYNRLTARRAYIPQIFECYELDVRQSSATGRVFCDDLIFFTKTVITKEYIRTIAVIEEKDLRKVKMLDNEVKIKKTNGVPDFFDKMANEFRPISISHHGRFESLVALTEY